MPRDKNFDVDEVLRKAIEAFWRRGYAATSMQDLVDCTGINRASLYATYGGKRSLFITALKTYDTEGRRALFADLENRYEPREAIRQLFLANAGLGTQPGKKHGCFMTNTALELAPHDAEVGAVVAQAQEEMEAFFHRLIVRGISSNQIPRNVDPVLAARGLLASLLGLLVLVRSRPDDTLLADMITDAMRKLS
jgi:TetR/AcrR family transcriptional repressor of nem operon